MWRKLFYVGSILLWCVVLLVMLEVVGRVWWRHEQRSGQAYANARREHGINWEKLVQQMTLAEAPSPPPDLFPPPDAPAFGTYSSLDSEGRAKLARRRGELVLFCGADGLIKEAYCPDQPADMQQLSTRVAEGKAAHESLPFNDDLMREDFRTAFRNTLGGAFQQRDYPLVLPDGTPLTTEFCFVRVSTNDRSDMIVVISPSLFKDLWMRYRSHVWRSENFGHWIVWTNNVGFRSKEVVLPKPPGVFRIVCIGGSTTFEGPRCDLTYPGILERKLRAQFKTDKIEVVNCGVYGIDSRREFERFSEYMKLEPDILVHYNFANDGNGVVDSVYRQAKWNALLRKSAWVRDREWGLPPTKAFDKAVREYTMINMQRICEAAKKAACPIVFCSFARPDVEHLEGMERTAFNAIFNDRLGRDILSYARAVDAYNAALRDMCGSMGVPYIAVSEGLTGGSERFIDHCHEYLNGIERKADLIFEGIKNLVAAKWKPAAPANPPVTQ